MDTNVDNKNNDNVQCCSLQCVICGELFGMTREQLRSQLQDPKRVLDFNGVSGQGICPEHQALLDKGMIALLEADIEREERLDRSVFVWAETYIQLFDQAVPANQMAFVNTAVMDRVEALMQHLQQLSAKQTRH